MKGFITVTRVFQINGRRLRPGTRLNIDHIISYATGYETSDTSINISGDEEGWWVAETVEQIDSAIRQACRREVAPARIS